jgi:hypothetical protein
MNRRKFIKGSLIFSSMSLLGFGSYKVYSIFRKPDYKYLLQNKAYIAEVGETLIPRTDTPGAKDAKVEDFVIHCVQKMLLAKEANTFIDGLKFVDDYCKDHYKKSFVNCTTGDRIAAINAAKAIKIYTQFPILNKVKTRLIGRHFVDLLKDMVSTGYCTSEIGATKGLAYEAVPVKFIACMPLAKGQRSWATK